MCYRPVERQATEWIKSGWTMDIIKQTFENCLCGLHETKQGTVVSAPPISYICAKRRWAVSYVPRPRERGPRYKFIIKHDKNVCKFLSTYNVGSCTGVIPLRCATLPAPLSNNVSFCFRRICTPPFPTSRTEAGNMERFGVLTSSFSRILYWTPRTLWWYTTLSRQSTTAR